MRTSFSEVKIVTIQATKADAIGFFESVALAGLEGEWFRVSAKQQREFFGNVPFGKRMVRVAKDGAVSVMRCMDFGSDFDIQTVRFDHSCKRWYYPEGDGARYLRDNVIPR